MFGIETMLNKYTGGNEALIMLGAFSLLILLNFVADMWVEITNKDLKWNDVPKFVKPICLNAMFLLGLDIVMIPAAKIPLAYDIFASIQMLGWLSAMAIYFYGFYKNLKKLGLKTTKRVDDAIENSVHQDNEEDVNQ